MELRELAPEEMQAMCVEWVWKAECMAMAGLAAELAAWVRDAKSVWHELRPSVVPSGTAVSVDSLAKATEMCCHNIGQFVEACEGLCTPQALNRVTAPYEHRRWSPASSRQQMRQLSVATLHGGSS